MRPKASSTPSRNAIGIVTARIDGSRLKKTRRIVRRSALRATSTASSRGIWSISSTKVKTSRPIAGRGQHLAHDVAVEQPRREAPRAGLSTVIDGILARGSRPPRAAPRAAAPFYAIVVRSMDRATAYAPGSTSNVGPGLRLPGHRDRRHGRPRAPRPRAGAAPGVRVSGHLRRAHPEGRRAQHGGARRRAGAAAVPALATSASSSRSRRACRSRAASAAARPRPWPGACAANALLRRGALAEELLECALEAEAVVAGRHADNAAPSLLGGAVLVLGTAPLRYARVGVHASLRFVFATPDYGVETARARAVLPATVTRAEAVGPGGGPRGPGARARAGRRRAAARRDLRPHRRAEPDPALPGLRAGARRRAARAGAFGVAVSGAGPTLVAVAPEPAASRRSARRSLARVRARRLRAPPSTWSAVDDEGARLE